MFLNIITPCSRPENLLTIAQSINIPKENYRWIIVFDLKQVPEIEIENAEMYASKNPESVSGNAQRNYAIDLVKDDHVYFNDDDTIIHPHLWENVKDLTNDFIVFNQDWNDNSPRLFSGKARLNEIDSHNFILHSSLIKENRWVLNRRDADGVFAYECARNSKSFIHVDKTLSIYNSLR